MGCKSCAGARNRAARQLRRGNVRGAAKTVAQGARSIARKATGKPPSGGNSGGSQ